VKIREILRLQKKKPFNPGAWLGMRFLNATGPRAISLMRKSMVQWGYAGQRLANGAARRVMDFSSQRPRATTGKPALIEQAVRFVDKPLPSVPARPLRGLLDIEDNKHVYILRGQSRSLSLSKGTASPAAEAESNDAVFYFPGCGSERLFSQVGLATLAMLFETGAQTVLPPGYLCCGYPQLAGGDALKGTQITTANRVLFHRIANTLNYLDIKTVLVSCGTCMDQLLKYEFERIFPGCRLLDIHEYLMEKGISLPEGEAATKYLYHDPCHTPMKQYPALQVARKLTGQADLPLSDRCCGEAGTFAVARPDIASQVRWRKQQEIESGLKKIAGASGKKILTACPSCHQGLSRYRLDTGVESEYIVVELARHLLGEDWPALFVETVKNGGVERVLL
jgi:Fe-S oxidoreductase